MLLAAPDPEHGWRYVGRVGTGFSRDQLVALESRLSRSTRRKPSAHVEVDDPELRKAHWVAPKHVAEVFHHGRGNQGLLRQPVFKTIRRDKMAKDLGTNGNNGAAPQAVAVAKPQRRKAAPSKVTAIELSSPERVVFAKDRITKAQVFDYYRTMLPWLLPEIEGRPLSVVRCPQGTGRPCFFQKHHTAGMEHVQSVPLKEEGGTRADYLVVNDEVGLLELVQFNALEFHPWGAMAAASDQADGIVFDLDPGPDVSWKQVVTAAREVRKRLHALGLLSFVRTSGGKGLHVFVPLRPPCGWRQVKSFARAFAESMVAEDPLAYVATASKKFRKGRIFIDYLRNGRGATSVASFSIRAREGAPVAMPLRWEELGRIKGGNAYDIGSAARRMARMEHPWGAFRQVQQGLGEVLARLKAGGTGTRAKKTPPRKRS